MHALNILTMLILAAGWLLPSYIAAQGAPAVPYLNIPPASMTPKQQLAQMRSNYALARQQTQPCPGVQAQMQVWSNAYQKLTAAISLPTSNSTSGPTPDQSKAILAVTTFLQQQQQQLNAPLGNCMGASSLMQSLKLQYAQRAVTIGLDPNIDPPNNPAQILTQQQIMSGAFSASDDGYGYYHDYSFDDLW